MKIILPVAPRLEIDLPEDVEAVVLSETEDVPAEHRDAQACVLWGMRPTTPDFVAQLPNVRWFQSLAAGPDGLLNSDLHPDTVVSIGTGFHDRTVAEHTLGLALALARQFPQSWEDQKAHRWSKLGRPGRLHPGDRVGTTVGSKVVVWGFGAIGQQIARVFSACGSNVVGVARSEGERAGFPVVSSDRILEVVADADFLVMVLPASAETESALNAEVLAALPKRAFVVNVGRGSTVDEEALMTALREGQIAGAAIDVVRNEPLAEDSPLWDTPNLLITPHNAGGRPEGADERVNRNLRAWLAGDIGSMEAVVISPK